MQPAQLSSDEPGKRINAPSYRFPSSFTPPHPEFLRQSHHYHISVNRRAFVRRTPPFPILFHFFDTILLSFQYFLSPVFHISRFSTFFTLWMWSWVCVWAGSISFSVSGGMVDGFFLLYSFPLLFVLARDGALSGELRFDSLVL